MFKMAEIKVEELEVMDIITASGNQGPSTGDDDLPWN